MPLERAEAILREGAGTQWVQDAVNAVLDEVHAGGPVVAPRLGHIAHTSAGQLPETDESLVDACLPGSAPLVGGR
jgi:hypothetical protein